MVQAKNSHQEKECDRKSKKRLHGQDAWYKPKINTKRKSATEKMYIHLGQETVVLLDDVIGIFDMDTSTISKSTRNYLRQVEQSGDVVNITYELPKTFIICRDKERPSGRKVYISQISSATLLKRAGYLESQQL